MADNFRFDLTGVALEAALSIAFGGGSGPTYHKLTHWGVQPERPPADRCDACWTDLSDKPRRSKLPERLVLFWTDPGESMFPEYHKLPAPLDAAGAVTIVRSWLDAVPYGREPDHDGDNKKGFRVYNEQWGHVAGCYQAFAAVEPVWLMYGK